MSDRTRPTTAAPGHAVSEPADERSSPDQQQSLAYHQRRTSPGQSKIMMVTFDETTGALAIDQAFGQEGIVRFGVREQPHGGTGPAGPHGVVLSRSRSE